MTPLAALFFGISIVFAPDSGRAYMLDASLDVGVYLNQSMIVLYKGKVESLGPPNGFCDLPANVLALARPPASDPQADFWERWRLPNAMSETALTEADAQMRALSLANGWPIRCGPVFLKSSDFGDARRARSLENLMSFDVVVTRLMPCDVARDLIRQLMTPDSALLERIMQNTDVRYHRHFMAFAKVSNRYSIQSSCDSSGRLVAVMRKDA